MMFLNIYIAFSLLTFILLLMQSYLIEKDLIREYPDAMKKHIKENKKNVLEKIYSYIKSFVSCFVPIINIGIFYASLFAFDEVKEKVLEKLQLHKYE